MLRRAALSKSWQRDLWIGTRREYWRWLVWALPRFILPIFAVVLLTLSMVYPFWQTNLPIAEPVLPAVAPKFFRLDTQWGTQQAAPQTAPDLIDDTTPTPTPILIPDDWLHSKEP